MPAREPLSPDEEVLWRAIIRITAVLPRALDDDLIRATGLSLNEYFVLLALSETDGRELRMAELAAAVALSPSRITRLVDDLRVRGLVTKTRCAADGRGHVAAITGKGLAQLESAQADHLAGAHSHVLDHINPAVAGCLGRSLFRVAEHLDT